MNVETRIKIEKRIVCKIVEVVLAAGYSVSVFDSEDWAIKQSTNKAAILKNTQATDEETIVVHDSTGQRKGSVYLVYGNDGYDVIADYSLSLEGLLTPANDLADKLEQQYS